MTTSKADKPSLQTGSLKDRQREQRAALIIQVASEVLIEKGYYEASMDEIAARVGISKGTLYLHFKSKEDLIFVLIEQETTQFLTLIDAIIDEPLSAYERLDRILLETYRSIHGGRQLLFALRSIGLTGGTIKDRLEEKLNMAGLMERLAALFEEGKKQGEFDPTTPTSILVSLFLALMEIYSNEQAVINQTAPDELSRSVSRIFFQGLLAKP